MGLKLFSLPRLFFLLVFLGSGILCCPSPSQAQTPLNDIELELGIEIGNEMIDFNDASLTVEKGRFVAYQVVVRNTGGVTHDDLIVLMDIPDYMEYVPATTYFQSSTSPDAVLLQDVEGGPPLAAGYEIARLYPGQEAVFTLQFQVQVPESVLDDPLYTVAWANVLGQYQATPITSNMVETVISGESVPTVQVQSDAFPSAGTEVYSGFQIVYSYTLHNVGGAPASGITFTTYQPQHTTCESGCGVFDVGTLEPNESRYITMTVTVDEALGAATEITNIGYDLAGDTIPPIQNREAVVHPLNPDAEPVEGDFTVDIIQMPDIILNSADGYPRMDYADRTETLYTLTYQGRNRSNTYPTLSPSGSTTITNSHCGSYTYPQTWGATTYAYNSNGGGCTNIYSCPPQSSAIIFNVDTTLPDSAPKLLFTVDEPSYAYGGGSMVNSFMKNGGTLEIPSVFTESRAVENGDLGVVETQVDATVQEDRYYYAYVGQTLWCTYTVCGEFSCSTYTVDRPVYEWLKSGSSNVVLSDDDATDITVYTSTAWLKTEGGHIGSNDELTNDVNTYANYVDIGANPVIATDHLTPSSLYTPPGESNAEYFIFGNNGTGSMETESGEDWKVTGTEFPFVQRGEVYDRAENPRSYYDDLLAREKFGEVRTDQLPDYISGIIDLGDDIIWSNSGDIVIGQAGVEDEVILAGGQSRIVTTGDVYINANIRYGSSQASAYNNITSVRIDANNIYVNGEVTDLEIMLLARNAFFSGQSKKQLRILGDVIANQSYWEREPLLETSPTEFNKPSEHIIEDMRKYVVPAPGDTEIPDQYDIWQQVNPATGDVLDGW